MLIASWNINGIKARIDGLTTWLQERSPDIACLQEIKSQDEGFPREAIEALGYHVETHGQKGFNGVALLSRQKPESVTRGLPGDESDEQSRYIEGVWQTGSGPLRVASIYLPNGNPLGTEKFAYKLAWMNRLERHAAGLLEREERVVLAGDYNVIPQPEDVHNPEAWTEDALFQPESRGNLRRLVHLGFADALRLTDDSRQIYTFWDYQAGAWQKNNGIRIDHLLLSPEAQIALRSVGIDKQVRSWEKPSDHVPIIAEIEA
ncbi:exodeoxyribonuclease III [Fulvimarina sp. 2208YS6-2-32]|uniref:Exodeoxyribonuclease III n=1 Tax=Fulvimarina uroteuthidis TaxID=3098149 RepID=A0ABU5I5D3_9HYPH|nr:exodeoxyribonuclease III [Fulvimarina sp. 2208YS6-2-32]MDY8110611.1 exodeoxyribonuclease III [Fulvimarina sp. 2208YS6-2-32]